MSLQDKEKKTVDYYDQSAKEWNAAHGGEDGSYWLSEMQKFHSLLPSGRVLEIGSGSGKDAKALIEMGYEYTGTDASQGLIEVAQERNPNATFQHKSVFDLDYPENSFDGFWTAATLLHIPKDRIDDALASIRKPVKVKGIGFISMKQGDGEKEDTNTGRWFSYYSQDEFAEVLLKNGFEIKDKEVRQGEKDTWLVFYVARKPQ